MQTRVACPACQTVLGVDPAYGDGARFRCPQCNFEFSVQLPQPPSHHQPLAPWPAQSQADTTPRLERGP
jgi:transposase-like protein